MIRISDLIARLSDIKEIHGDLECYYASDDEGNSYQRVAYPANTMYLNNDNEIMSPLSVKEAKEYKHVCCIN